jgi:hypothetical protein
VTFDKFLALCNRTEFLDRTCNVVDAVDQLPVSAVVAFHLQCLKPELSTLMGLVNEELRPRIEMADVTVRALRVAVVESDVQ